MNSSEANQSKINKVREDDKFISFIYYEKKGSPKYFEIKKRTFFWWLVILPGITLFSLTIMAITLVHFSPSHIWQNYLNAKNFNDLTIKVKNLENENTTLKEKIEEFKLTQTTLADSAPTNVTEVPTPSSEAPPQVAKTKLEVTQTPSPRPIAPTHEGDDKTLGFSLIKPVPGQKDRTKPAQLQLSGFATETLRDTVQLRFNITPLLPGEQKIAGHILVIMKGETGLQVYPQMSLNAPESQINYTAGESFATQRFRPVDAGFLKPRKAGQYVFTVLIFARNGDLIHSQSVGLFVKL